MTSTFDARGDSKVTTAGTPLGIITYTPPSTVPINNRITAEPDKITVNYEKTTKLDVLDNDKHSEGEPICIRGADDGAKKGTMELAPSGGHLIYTPWPDRFGEDSFVYIVCEAGSEAIASGTVTVTIGEPADTTK